MDCPRPDGTRDGRRCTGAGPRACWRAVQGWSLQTGVEACSILGMLGSGCRTVAAERARLAARRPFFFKASPNSFRTLTRTAS